MSITAENGVDAFIHAVNTNSGLCCMNILNETDDLTKKSKKNPKFLNFSVLRNSFPVRFIYLHQENIFSFYTVMNH